MIELLEDMPDDTVGFRVAGAISRDDYTGMLIPELHKAVESGRGLRTVYLIEDLDEIEARALWEDARLGFDLAVRHHGEWRRSAIVTDHEWIASATRLFVWMIPGEARAYRVAELDEAKAWVAGGGA